MKLLRPHSHPLGKFFIAAALALLLTVAALPGAAQDSTLNAHRERADLILQGNLTALKAWAAAGTSDPGRLSLWTVAAGFCLAKSDPTLLPAARTLAANLLGHQVKHLFVGGNDGWPAWATADTCVRYHAFIRADPARYAPENFPANPDSPDGKYSLDDLFKIVLTRSFYAPIDSTSNHYLMNATARFLAEMAYPGEVAQPFNGKISDPTGAQCILRCAKGLELEGPSEYGSPNYGADNWGQFLSLAQLTSPATPLYQSVKQNATIAYEAALCAAGAFWMNGNLAMPTGRGYPSIGAWGVASGDVLTWVYFGGDFGNSNLLSRVCDTGIKTLGVLGAESLRDGYLPPVGLLHLADGVPRVTQANFGQNHQYSYRTARYGHSCESYKDGGRGGWQTHWNSRVLWTKPYHHVYQATAWIANVVVNATIADGVVTPTLDKAGHPFSVDPFTLQPYPTYGSGTYGAGCYEDVTQSFDTVLHVINLPPVNLAGTPGGCMPVRGALIYLPVPHEKNDRDQLVVAPDNYIPPALSPDGMRVYVAFNSVLIAFLSSVPIAHPKPTDIIANGKQQFFRIYGGPEPDRPTDPNQIVQFAVAVQTADPETYPGATLADKFARFTAEMEQLSVPRMAKPDPRHPVWQFSNGKVSLASTYQGDRRHGGNDGQGEDWIGGPNNENPRLIDYWKWPHLREWFVGQENLVLDQPQKGDLTVRFPGTPSTCYHFADQTAVLIPEKP